MNYSSTFFEVTAQLIPVLFLAMVVEDKLQPAEDETPSDRVMRSWIVASLVIGEVLSLAVVASGLRPSVGLGSLVASTMLVSALLIVTPVLERQLRSERSRWERRGHALAGIAVVVGVLSTFVAIAFS